ncbi:acyl-CoA carboxylase subunit epsilon [Rhodococcus zopfii]|uniref:Acyl-CoA carboxylase subunit epsilon n=1 Tax=Rhodococcus zopfii TaxID=43772 RepID=A0ABU3WMK8_9NOCA|nr:acyl-CoA carboxylase subunit epsilon [Rhodococcus zopfii]MDV2474874.1 acyl-CoA carboxylase subunit epsilon [Rhodococcus zopfii]
MTATTEEKIITDIDSTEAADATVEGAVVEAAGDDAVSDSVTAEAVVETAAALHIVKGNPSDEDIAALVSVLAAASSGAAPEGDGRPAETWGAPTRMHRQWAPFSPYSYPNLG